VDARAPRAYLSGRFKAKRVSIEMHFALSYVFVLMRLCSGQAGHAAKRTQRGIQP
jgi:hypothetical protein